ncbi:MAG: glycosyltransferase family 2 protein [Candidatus Symbiobacter sp.]|nr:glycosyltransferase family 2 protein [Candidatus Symbiobacter sp.]
MQYSNNDVYLNPDGAKPASLRPTDRPTLSIVVPVYNGAASIGILVEAIAALPPPAPGGIEVVLVNDASPDESLGVCQNLLKTATIPLILLDLSRNFGEYNAVMAGLRAARGDYVITMDDDLQNPPEEVLKLFAYCRDQDFDVVYTHYDVKHHAAWRNWGSKFHNWMAGRLLGAPKNLYFSSFRCMNRFIVAQITQYDGPFAHQDGLIMQTTRRIGQIKVKHHPRQHGTSNYNLRRLLRVWLAMALNFSIMPLRLASLAGFVASLVGVIGMAMIMVEKLLGEPPLGWSSLALAIFCLAGVQLLMLGIVGEYIGRIFMTINRVPQTIIRQKWQNFTADEKNYEQK